MPRIRCIKPEFPQSESMGRVSRDARLLFVLLWTIVDDAGRTRAHSRALASLLYPYDDDAKDQIDGWMDELVREGCVHLYVVDGAHYLQVCKWRDHQKIDRPSKSKFPDPREASSNPRESSRGLVARSGSGSGSRKGKGEGDLAHDAPTSTQHYVEPSAPTHTSTDEPPVVDAATGYVIGHARMGAGRSGGSLPGRAPHAAYQCEAFTVPTFLHQKFLGRLQNVNDASPEATLQAWYRTLRDRMAGQETPAKEVQWLSDEFDVWRKPQPVMGVKGSRTTGNATAAAAVIARIRKQAAQEAS